MITLKVKVWRDLMKDRIITPLFFMEAMARDGVHCDMLEQYMHCQVVDLQMIIIYNCLSNTRRVGQNVARN
jgi:hypothetical protein